MRINIYSQELLLSPEADIRVTELISKVAEETADGHPLVYSAVRLYLESSAKLHHPPADDDRSAITFWLPQSPNKREMLALNLEILACLVRQAPPETGLD